MDLSHGGHLTHGAPVSHMGKLYNFIRYKTYPEEKGRIDFQELRRVAVESKPKMILCGYSSYPRDYDYAQFKSIADEVGALTMADVSHIGGLIAGGVMRNPCDAGFDFVTTTTHKSMRGPRGGMILCKEKFAKEIDKSVFPGLQGGPHMNAVAGVAITLGKALMPEFKQYCKQVLTNAQALSNSLAEAGANLITGGTENHMMVIDMVKSAGINGRVAEEALDAVSITTNKQIIPDDPNPPLRPSGIRIGTPAATTRGMKELEMKQLGSWIMSVVVNHEEQYSLEKIRKEVEEMCRRYPVPGID
jgi:glycine hydroxymethyltransferase